MEVWANAFSVSDGEGGKHLNPQNRTAGLCVRVKKTVPSWGELEDTVGNIQECRMQLSMLECDLATGSNLVKRTTGTLMRINVAV